MNPRIVTPPVLEDIISLDELHLQLKLGLADGEEHPEDALIWRYLGAARAKAQHECNRAIGEQTVEVAADDFPCSGYEGLALPLGPVTAITTVKYFDIDGVEQTLAAPAYTLDVFSTPAQVRSVANADWPVTQECTPNAVKVAYTCGDVPEAVLQAMLLIVGGYMRNRQEITDRETHRLWLGAESLFGVDKVWC